MLRPLERMRVIKRATDVPTIPRRVRAILNKYSATMLLPGVNGALRFGFQPGNYRESTGQTLAGADQQVGLVVDAARVPGPNVAASSSVNGVAIGGPAFTNYPVATLTAGRWYAVSVMVSGYSGSGTVGFSGSPVVGFENIANTIGTRSGDGSISFVAQATGAAVTLFTRSTNTCNFSNISVRELPGIHGSVATSGFQPVLRRGLVNQLLWSSDFSNASWALFDGATATSTTLSIGTGAQSRAVRSASFSGDITVAVQCNPSDAGKAIHLSVWATGLDGFSPPGRTTTSLIIPASGVVTHSWANVVAGTYVGIMRTGTAFTLNNPRIGLFQGTVTADQIIAAGGIQVTTTSPASSANGIQSLQFDGSDDRLSLSAVPFQTQDVSFAITAFNPAISDGTLRRLWEIGGNGSENTVGVFNGDVRWLSVGSSGAQVSLIASGYGQVGTPAVASAVHTGSERVLRIDGVQRAASVTVVNPSTANVATLGNRAAGDRAFSGHKHLQIFGKGTTPPTEAELRTLERWAASLQGRSL